MFNIKNLFNRDNNICKDNNIVYENGIVKNEILSWCKNLGINNIRDLLIKLGFSNNDKIYLYQDYGNLYRVIYSVNEDKINNNNFIWFNYKRKEIVVNSGNESKCYSIDLSNDKDKNLNIDLIYCKKEIDDRISCYNRLGKNNILFIIDNRDYELTLEIYTYAKIFRDEIDDLEIYLTSLKFPIVIDKVYSDICYILSLEQGIMEMFNLVVTKNVSKKKPDFVMDEILIQKGMLERITKTSDGRRITFDKDGNYIYDKIDNNSLLTIKYNTDSKPNYRYSYKDRSNDNNGSFNEEELSRLKNDAKKEIDDVKKLIKELF